MRFKISSLARVSYEASLYPSESGGSVLEAVVLNPNSDYK